MTVGWGVLTVVADFNRTHATNAAWTPHARFHVVWQLRAACLSADLVARPVGGRAALLRRAHGSDCVCSVLCRAERDANLWRRGLRRKRLSTVRGALSNHRKEMGRQYYSILGSAHHTCGRTRGGERSSWRGLING